MNPMVAYWLRWIAVLPSAFVANLVCDILAGLVFRYLVWLPIVTTSDFFIQIFQSGISTGAFIWAGALVAPRWKNITGTVMASLHMVISIGAIAFEVKYPTEELWTRIIALGVGIAVSVVMIVQFAKEGYEEKEKEPQDREKDVVTTTLHEKTI